MDTATQVVTDSDSSVTPVPPPAADHRRASARDPVDDPTAGIFAPPYRQATVGILGLVSLIAFEAMGSAVVMPVAATALDGLARYGFLFGGPLATAIVGMVLAGGWSDRRSPIGVVRAGSACFVAGLLLAGLAESVGGLLLGRLTTGFGSGMLAVALYALVGRLYRARLHSAVFAAFSAAWILPALLGPFGSGLLAQLFGWRWALIATALLSLPIALGLARIRLPRAAETSPAARHPASRTVWALVAAAAALTLHVLGQSSDGARSVPAALPALAAMLLALGALLVAGRQLLPAGTLRARRGLPAAIALSGLSQGAFFAAEAFLPLLLHRERQIPVGVAGLLLSVGAVSWSLGAAYRARAFGRASDTRLLRAGFALLAGGIVLSSAVLVPTVPVFAAVIGWAAAGDGMGLVSPTLSVKTLALASPGEQGRTGSALRLSAALATTATLAVSGAAFALLLHAWPSASFAACMGMAAALAAAGWLVSHRTDRPAA